MADAFHSAIRWEKPVAELKTFVDKDPEVVNKPNEKNGNTSIHLAAQNGHFEIVKWLLTVGADINAQNGKGQTALHMSVEYDMYDQSDYLVANGAKKDLKNGEGHEAYTGIEGGKVGFDAPDGPMTALKRATDKATLDAAFSTLEAFDKEKVDKAMLIQTAMGLKKGALKPFWDAGRFTAIVQSCP